MPSSAQRSAGQYRQKRHSQGHDDARVAEGREQREGLLSGSPGLAVHDDLALLVEHEGVEGSGVQVEAGGAGMLLGAKSHRSLFVRGVMSVPRAYRKEPARL